jgi:hypothetical protein
MSNNVYKVTILPNGAIPTEMMCGGKEPNKDTTVQGNGKRSVEAAVWHMAEEHGEQVQHLIEEIILLKKRLKSITVERDAYKQYVPTELLSFGTLIKWPKSSTGDEKQDAGQITDDE